MKKSILKSTLVIISAILLTSCSAGHSGYMANSASLSSANFSYIKQNIKGEATATYILGIGGLAKETLVNEIMASNVITVKPDDNLDYCMELMYTKKIRHLPVLDNETIIGIISIGDVVKSIIDLQKETIHYLDSYINGGTI